MTIRDLDSGRHVSGVLDRGERGVTFKRALSRMSEADVAAVRTALDERIEGSRIETSAWMPGSDWRGTPWQPIYDVGARGSFEQAAMMFGLFVWEAFDRHPADWFTTRFSAGGEEDRFVPLILVGDEKAEVFFRKNPKLSARLGTPLRLEPLDPDSSDLDLKLFARFCDALDKALVHCGATSAPSGFRNDDTLDALLIVSGGHVGRVARLVEEALPEAIWRGANSVEPYDLSNATRTYAVQNGWISCDPFSTPYARRSAGR